MKQDKKRSRSSSASSTLSDDIQGSRDRDETSADSSSDSDVVQIEVKRAKKKKKHRHRHPEKDENDSSTVHEERNGKEHRHKCRHRHHHHHHHHHHRHHGHHKHHCHSKNNNEKDHTRSLARRRALLNSDEAEVVRVKQEPVDETDDSNSRMSQKSQSSRRQDERGQSSRINGSDQTRYEQNPETSNSSGEREIERKRERNKNSAPELAQARNEDRGTKRPKKDQKRGGRKNRWETEGDTSGTNRPIKQEPSSDGEYEWGKKSNPSKDKKLPPGEKSKPNFGLSGKLAEDTNTFNGVVIKYSEPPEARKPKRRWRLYPFKGDQGLPTLYIHRQSCYLIGRDRKVADIPVDHPSCSKQHAALQYRLVPYEREDGTVGKRVRPYIIDLESSNATFVNGVKIEAKKYVELMEKDVVKFGYSSREYVLLHEQSKDDELDDDVRVNEETGIE